MITFFKEKFGCIIKIAVCAAALGAAAAGIYLLICEFTDKEQNVKFIG